MEGFNLNRRHFFYDESGEVTYGHSELQESFTLKGQNSQD